jgi:ABC-2 type transport system ATP-binding protein
VRDFLRRLNREQGTTVLLTSHYMDDIEELCPRVLVIDQGRLHFDGALAALMERSAPHKRINAVFVEPPSQQAAAAALAGLCASPGDDPLRISLSVPREQVADIAARLLRLGGIADVSIEEPPVEEIIRAMFSAQAAAREQA